MTTKITYEMGDYLKEIYGNDCATNYNASYDTVNGKIRRTVRMVLMMD